MPFKTCKRCGKSVRSVDSKCWNCESTEFGDQSGYNKQVADATSNWHAHLQQLNANKGVMQRIKDELRERPDALLEQKMHDHEISMKYETTSLWLRTNEPEQWVKRRCGNWGKAELSELLDSLPPVNVERISDYLKHITERDWSPRAIIARGDIEALRLLPLRFSAIELLIQAVESGKYECVKVLLDTGADPNALSQDRSVWKPPLLLAVSRGYLEIVRLLLSRGANPKGREYFQRSDSSGYFYDGSEGGPTPLEIALTNGYHEIAHLLGKAG